MLPSSRRVPRTMFGTVLKSPHVFHSDHFSVRVSPFTNTALPSRISVVVASAVLKKAHDRNLLKRRTRAVIESRLSVLKNGLAAVFFAKKSAKDLNFAEIESSMDILLKKASLVVL